MGQAQCTNCCTTRDRNDKIEGIESRNDKFFFYNFPGLIKDIDSKLEEAQANRDEKGGNKLSSLDLNHLKWVVSQLESEIDANQRNLEYEKNTQRYKKRLALEICDSEGLNLAPGLLSRLSTCKCLVRVQFKSIQKKTKKNINCKNPKFFEIFRFPIHTPIEYDSVLI